MNKIIKTVLKVVLVIIIAFMIVEFLDWGYRKIKSGVSKEVQQKDTIELKQ